MRAFIACVPLLLVVVLTTAASAAPVSAACDDGLAVTPDTIAQTRRAVRCLLNEQRVAHARRPLRHDGRLQRAATRHSRHMVATRVMAHADASSTLASRALAAGYLRPGRAWMLAEDLGWGTGVLSTPAAVVAAWMDSPLHRQNVLSPVLRDVGIGVSLGGPSGTGVTYTADFGRVWR